QAEEARRAAALALEQGERAEAVRRILVGVFEQAAPEANEGQPITALELLEKGERQIEGAIGVQPAVEADAATLIAELYVQIGVFDRAEVLLQRALQATDDPRVPDDVRARVLVGIASIEDEKAAHDDAIEHARRGLDLLADGGRGVAPTVAKAHYVIAHSLIALGRVDEAEALLRESLERDRAALGENSDAVADGLVQLGNVHAEALRFDASEQAFRQAIAAFSATYGPDSYHVAHVLNELSNMLQDKRDLAGAEAALRQSLDIRLRTVGEDHRDTLIVRHNLLILLEGEGRMAEALPQRLAVLERVGSSARLHPRDVASYRLAAGRDQRDLGDFLAAVANLRTAYELFSASLGKDSDSAISTLRSLGSTLQLAGRMDEAESVLRRALELQRGRAPANPLRLAAVEADLGNLLRLRGGFDEARTLLAGAANALAAPVYANHAARPAVMVAQAELELAEGDTEHARENAESALRLARITLPQGYFQLASPLLTLARVHLARNEAAQAEPLLDEALRVRTAVQPGGDVRVIEIEIERVRAFGMLGRAREATSLREAVAARLRALPPVQAAGLQARMGNTGTASGSRR
ncbi:MAG: tetratricopeptide repeat protein, partial [Xanthomonadales bacterium]|nr:tetratricopeptide repeat protein [Xanthomonadales bacterium]